jgi:hypothetical protein
VSTDHLPLLAVAVAWGALWANVVVVPFFNKDESLFKDLIDSGARDLAYTGIDTETIVPAFTRLCEQVLLERQQLGDGATVSDVIAEFDLQPYLRDAEAAMREKQSIQAALDDLRSLAGMLWKVGLAHIVFALLIPAALIFVAPGSMQDAGAYGGAGVAAVTLVLMIGMLLRFERRRRSLHTALSRFRRAGSRP